MKVVSVLYHVENPELAFIGGYGHSNAIDLYTAEDITIDAGEFALVSLGVSIKLPEGYKADLKPRSGTFKKYGLIQTNSVGLIDNNYSGANDIYMMPVFKPFTKKDFLNGVLEVVRIDETITDEGKEVETFQEYKNMFLEKLSDFSISPVTIPKGTRLCQMEIVPVMEEVSFASVPKENWEGSDRGGFGSTGR